VAIDTPEHAAEIERRRDELFARNPIKQRCAQRVRWSQRGCMEADSC
jgi:hypothetical protein